MSRTIAAALAVYISTFAVVLPTAQSETDGKTIFRFDTFGSEQLWTDVLRMQHVITDAVSPATGRHLSRKSVGRLQPQLGRIRTLNGRSAVLRDGNRLCLPPGPVPLARVESVLARGEIVPASGQRRGRDPVIPPSRMRL